MKWSISEIGGRSASSRTHSSSGSFGSSSSSKETSTDKFKGVVIAGLYGIDFSGVGAGEVRSLMNFYRDFGFCFAKLARYSVSNCRKFGFEYAFVLNLGIAFIYYKKTDITGNLH